MSSDNARPLLPSDSGWNAKCYGSENVRHSIAFVCAVVATSALAQQSAPQPATEQPDVAIIATVHADYLRFTEKPQVSVTFPGQEQNNTVWKSERTNLPDEVMPYVIYRDIGLRLTISSTLPNIEQIVDEALAPQPQPQPVAPAKSKSRTRR